MHVLVWLGRLPLLYLLYRFLSLFLRVTSEESSDLSLLFVSCESSLLPVVCSRVLIGADKQASDEKTQELTPGQYLEVDTISMGQAPLNDVQLKEPEIALFHLCIEKRDRFIVRKTDQNPVYLNGDSVEVDAVLSLGDVLKVGSYLFVVVKGFAHTRRS